MASESDEVPNDGLAPDFESSTETAIRRLTKDFEDLSDKAQQLLTEKLILENEFAPVSYTHLTLPTKA